jgi:hypothetical protein
MRSPNVQRGGNLMHPIYEETNFNALRGITAFLNVLEHTPGEAREEVKKEILVALEREGVEKGLERLDSLQRKANYNMANLGAHSHSPSQNTRIGMS